MHGPDGRAGADLDKNGIQCVAIRQEVIRCSRNQSEPILPHVAMLQQTVRKEKMPCRACDRRRRDRIGAVAEDGSFVDSHKCFAILANWLLERKKWPGDLVRAFNTTRNDRPHRRALRRKLHECPIGFKYIADLMMDHEILIGGEESAASIWTISS